MRFVSVVAAAALSALPCAASPLTAAGLQTRIRAEAAACPATGTRLQIERLAIVGAREHDKVRRDMGARSDGKPGHRYAVIYVRSGKQVAPVASLGPLDANVKLDDLRSLYGTDYCDMDEG